MSIRLMGFATALMSLVLVAATGVQAADPDLEARADQAIALLAGPSFADRQRAVAELVKLDAAAVEPLADAAEQGEPELVKNCIRILKRIQTGGSDEGKKGAEAALKELSKSKLPQVANAAASALKEETEPGPGRIPGNRNLIPQIGGGTRITVQNVNGQRTIHVSEGDRQIEIRDDSGKNIRMTVKEKVDGKEETKEYTAKDLDDLKKKDERAAEFYEKYGKENLIQLPFQAFGPPGIRIRGPGGAAGGRMANAANEKIEAALKTLSDVREKLEALKDKKDLDPKEIEALLDELKQAEKELSAAQGALGR